MDLNINPPTLPVKGSRRVEDLNHNTPTLSVTGSDKVNRVTGKLASILLPLVRSDASTSYASEAHLYAYYKNRKEKKSCSHRLQKIILNTDHHF